MTVLGVLSTHQMAVLGVLSTIKWQCWVWTLAAYLWTCNTDQLAW